MDVTGAIPGVVYPYTHPNNLDVNKDNDVVLRSLSDIRMEGKESEASLLKQMGLDSAMRAKESADSTFRLHDNIRNTTDAILTASALTQAQVASTASITQAAIAAASSAALIAGERQTASILAAMSSTELRQLQDELNETRLERNRYHGEVNFGNQINQIQSQLNSLDQVQRSTNQAINFGTGNIAPQTSTSNQVR